MLEPIYKLLGKWRPTPVRRPFEITGELRKRLEESTTRKDARRSRTRGSSDSLLLIDR